MCEVVKGFQKKKDNNNKSNNLSDCYATTLLPGFLLHNPLSKFLRLFRKFFHFSLSSWTDWHRDVLHRDSSLWTPKPFPTSFSYFDCLQVQICTRQRFGFTSKTPTCPSWVLGRGASSLVHRTSNEAAAIRSWSDWSTGISVNDPLPPTPQPPPPEGFEPLSTRRTNRKR